MAVPLIMTTLDDGLACTQFGMDFREPSYLCGLEIRVFGEKISARDAAYDDDDLDATLVLDNDLEDSGMHREDRLTCWLCQDWVTDDHHYHDLTTGELTSAKLAAA